MAYNQFSVIFNQNGGGTSTTQTEDSTSVSVISTATDENGTITRETETINIGTDTETSRTAISSVSSVKVWLDGVETDITSYVLTNQIEIQDRCDEAFAMGSFEAVMPSTYSYNIPPYTPLFINGEFFVCKSTCSTLPTGDKVLHTFEVMEGTAMLSCFIVGTKSFSTTGWNKFDRKKIEILLTLMTYKYNYNFNFSSLEFYDQIQYDFGAGSTLFDCLTEIGTHYNKRVRVTNFDVASKTISLEFVKLDAGTSYTNDQVMSRTFAQDTDTYGYYLESEASNVVDRTTLTHVNGLTCRAADSLLNADTAILKLPSKAEQITDFGLMFKDTKMLGTIKVPSSYITRFGLNDTYYQYRILCHTVTYTKTDGTTGHLFQDLWDNVFSQWFSDENNFMARAWLSSGDGTFIMQNFTYEDQDVEDIPYGTGRYSMQYLLLEKSEWDLLTAAEQTEYAVYTSGGNTIENLNATYKDDIWDILIHTTRYPFLDHIGAYVTYADAIDTIKYKMYPVTSSNNPLAYQYYVDYYAIVDPVFINEKSETPLNESAFKAFGRSYNANAGYIDYDKIIDSMAITNNSIGRTELTLELDCTGKKVPFARQTITYNSVTWYISSVVTTYYNSHKTCVINCVRNYNKKAEAIGVETQFNKTNNPLANIVTRPVHIKCEKREAFGFGTNYSYYVKLRFEDKNHYTIANVYNGTGYIYLWKRCVCMETSNKVLFYCEMEDQYCADTLRKASNSSNYEIMECKYVDSNNECMGVEATIYATYTDDPSSETLDDQIADSYLLPLEMSLTTLQVTVTTNVTIYKDARERLTFTFEMEKE